MNSKPSHLRLEQLALRGFRNLGELDLEPGPRFNVLSGDNGQGKSNLLEAIHYLGALKSFRLGAKDDLIAYDADYALLAARFMGEGSVATTAKVRLDRTRARSLKLDDKRPRSSASWVSSFQMVLFHPGDIAIATGSPDVRRGAIDRVLEQIDVTYAKTQAEYQKCLRSRNRLIKREADRRSITAYDELLASAGAVIGQARASLLTAIKPHVEEAFLRIAGARVALRVDYQPKVEPAVAALREALARVLDKDLARGFTSVGPHSDDIVLRVDARAARHHASQGQHRIMVLALKIAELEVLGQRVGRVPILLMDDVSSELDSTRSARLFEVLDALGGQVFLTTTRQDLIGIADRRVDLTVVGGRVSS